MFMHVFMYYVVVLAIFHQMCVCVYLFTCSTQRTHVKCGFKVHLFVECKLKRTIASLLSRNFVHLVLHNMRGMKRRRTHAYKIVLLRRIDGTQVKNISC